MELKVSFSTKRNYNDNTLTLTSYFNFYCKIYRLSFFPFLKERVLHSKNVAKLVCLSQSKMSFFILRLSELLMELYCSLSRTRSPNMKSDFTSGLTIAYKFDQSVTRFSTFAVQVILMNFIEIKFNHVNSF